MALASRPIRCGRRGLCAGCPRCHGTATALTQCHPGERQGTGKVTLIRATTDFYPRSILTHDLLGGPEHGCASL